jgi:hypothetical protein
MLDDNERQLRISRLEKLLTEEKEKLAADRASMPKRIEDRYRMLVRPPSQNPNRADRKREEPASNTTASPAK